MNNMIYLLNIGVSGIKCIKDEVRLNFYKKTIDKDFNPEKYRVKAVYGENGSGKSAIVTAVKMFQDIILRDHYLSESKTQIFLGEIVNKTTKSLRFDCEFLVKVKTAKFVYNYSIEIGLNDNGLFEIQHELLRMKKGDYANKKYSIIFESKNGELVQINCEEEERNLLEKKSLNLLRSNSFIYLYIVNLREMDNFERSFLVHIVMVLTLAITLKVYIAEEDQHELYFLRKRLTENALGSDGLLRELGEVGESLNLLTGVNERRVDKQYYKRYEERVERLTQFIRIFKKDLVSIDIDRKEDGEQYVCDLNLNYGSYVINKEFESTGIKKLIRLFDCFAAASNGGIVFIDEMDSNLNDVYLCKLIEYFMCYGTGQLCFTTHNLDPMTILRENKNSIDFLSSDNHLVTWTARGNASPDNCYRNGMIEDSPFNIDATDFVGIFGE